MTVDAERELRSTDSNDDNDDEEDQKSASEHEEEEESEEEEEDDNGGIKGVTFCLTGHMSAQRAVIVKAIVSAGGKVAGTVTKDVSVLIAEDPDAKSQKLDKAREDGVKVVGEDYLKKYIKY